MLALLLSVASVACAADLSPLALHLPRPVLREEYQPICHRPLEYLGFSFSGPPEELRAMKAVGANMVGLGAMWTPVQDASAPYGCGVTPVAGAGRLSQTFVAQASFDGLAPCLPTGFSTDSGCSWRLKTADGDARVLASGTWERLRDNSWPEATFAELPPGRYELELSSATGTWIGWWARSDDPYPQGQARIAGQPQAGSAFELRIRAAGRWRDLISPSGAHHSIFLGPADDRTLAALGLHANYDVGDWNNPGFPYYPDWFNERFPEALARDQDGALFLGGMFDKPVPAPGIESPVIQNGVTRHIRTTVAALRGEEPIAYWVMGGESMYATYGAFSRWFDYSPGALRHFRAWLGLRYPTVAALNAAWGSAFGAFGAADPPRQPEVSRRWLDWLDFRFVSMGERFCWHYRAARSEDPARLVLTCNHGTLYQDITYAALGARPELYAAASDGFETGQIMTDADPELYNLMYTESLTTLGKPYCPARLAYKKTDPRARGGGTSYTPDAARRYLYETLGADAWHLGLIQWSGSLPDGEWGIAGTPAEKEIARLFAEVKALQPVLEDMHAAHPRLGVFVSHPLWALRGFLPEWRQFHVAAVERQIPKLYVYDEQIKSGQLDGFDTILSLGNSMVDPAVVAGLQAFVDGGGKLIVAGRFAEDDAGGTPASSAAAQALLRSATVIGATDSAAILAALAPALGPQLRPVEVSAPGELSRPLEVSLAPQAEDWPQDLRSARSLGQRVKVPRDGLQAVAIRTPTYYQKPQQGFRFEVLLGGPGGPVIASRDIPGGVADNSWPQCPVPTPPPAGAMLYVRATADPALPPAHLGWWSTHRPDIPGGQAFADDQPVAGARQVRLLFQEPVPASTRLETAVLSDGLSFGITVISLSDQPMAVTVDPSRLVADLGPESYRLTCPVAPQALKTEGLRGVLQLPPRGAALLHLERQVSAEEAGDLVQRALATRERWRALGAVTPFVDYACSKAREQLAAGRSPKAAALALKVLSQMGLRADLTTTPDGGLRLVARCFAPDGSPVTPQAAVCELVPTSAFWRAPATSPDGTLTLDLSRAALPPIWDYAGGKYAPFAGPLRLRLAARAGALRTQILRDVTVK